MKPHKITEVYIVVAVQKDGSEGLPAINMGGGVMPLVGTSEKMLHMFRAIIPEIIERDPSVKVKILKFTNCEELSIS